jgi:hypothetical protein
MAARVNLVKVIARRTGTAETLSKAIAEQVTEVQQFIKLVVEEKKSESGNRTVYQMLRQMMENTAGCVIRIDMAVRDIVAHNKLCEFTPALDAASGGPTAALRRAAAELLVHFEHLENRLKLQQDAALKSFRKRQPEVSRLATELATGSMAWRKALTDHVKSEAFASRFNTTGAKQTLPPIDADEILGSAAAKKAFMQLHVPALYAELHEEKKRTRDFLLDDERYDITGTRYPDAAESVEDSDASLSDEDDDDDLASDEIDPDAVVESESSEDSFAESEGSGEVSQATGMFEANIKVANKDIVKAARHTRVERNGRRLRSNGFRSQLDQLAPLLEEAAAGERDAIRRAKKRRLKGGAGSEDDDSEKNTPSSSEADEADALEEILAGGTNGEDEDAEEGDDCEIDNDVTDDEEEADGAEKEGAAADDEEEYATEDEKEERGAGEQASASE